MVCRRQQGELLEGCPIRWPDSECQYKLCYMADVELLLRVMTRNWVRIRRADGTMLYKIWTHIFSRLVVFVRISFDFNDYDPDPMDGAE